MKRQILSFTSILMVFLIFCLPAHGGFGPFVLGRKLNKRLFPKINIQQKGYKDPLLDYILPRASITPKQHRMFLYHLNQKQSLELWKSLKGDTPPPKYLGIDDLNKELLWAASHWLEYPFKDEQYIDYTLIVRWTAKKLGIPENTANLASTFQLENAICEKVFEKMWDKLSVEQRKNVLKDSSLSPEKIAAISALSGAAVIPAIAGPTVAIMGFDFYILVAKTLVVAAGAILNLSAPPVIVAISTLAGPVGWAIAGVAIATEMFIIGQANLATTTAYIVQIHCFKVRAMERSGVNYKGYLLRRTFLTQP